MFNVLLKTGRFYPLLPRIYTLPDLVLEVGGGKLKHDLRGKLKCIWVIICKILIMVHKLVSLSSFSFSFILFMTQPSFSEWKQKNDKINSETLFKSI